MMPKASEYQIRSRLRERRRERSMIIAPPGYISEYEAYTYWELLQRVGLGEHWVRKAERQGLKTLRAGRVKLIRGRDLLEFLERILDAETEPQV